MMNVLGLGRSVFISWHSDHSRGDGDEEKGQCVGEQRGERPAVIAIYLYRRPNRQSRPIWKRTGALWWEKTTDA